MRDSNRPYDPILRLGGTDEFVGIVKVSVKIDVGEVVEVKPLVRHGIERLDFHL
jgi:hypothetical protein